MGSYYDCRLTLRPAVDPVCCPQGYIFSREAILENLLVQKKNIKKKMAAWQKATLEQTQREQEKAEVDKGVSMLAFDKRNHGGSSESVVEKMKDLVGQEAKLQMEGRQTVSSVMNIRENEARMKTMNAFWVPGKGPEVEHVIEKPNNVTLCPASGKPLKLKDLISLHMKRAPGGDEHDFIDPVSGDSFTNSSRLVVLKPTGDVMLMETFKRVVKNEGQYNGTKIDDDDVLELHSGGSGFAAHDSDAIMGQKYFALGSGLNRGQTAGRSGTNNGLLFRN